MDGEITTIGTLDGQVSSGRTISGDISPVDGTVSGNISDVSVVRGALAQTQDVSGDITYGIGSGGGGGCDPECKQRVDALEEWAEDADDRLDTLEADSATHVDGGYVSGNTVHFTNNGVDLFTIGMSGGGGGTMDYEELNNKPQIEGETLIGNKMFPDLHLSPIDTTDLIRILV